MLYIPVIVSLFSLIFTYFLIIKIKEAPSNSGKMIEISQDIREGAMAFLNRQYRAVGIVALILFFILWIFLGFKTGFGFLAGAATSALAGFIGMMVSIKANVKVAEAAQTGLEPALKLAFKGGSAIGFLVVGLGLLSVSGFYLLWPDFKGLVALCFGASLIAIFARLGGGIFTKAADVGVELVGKIEQGIPEDDSRNPVMIAGQVGNNVGDCAGMAGDMFQSYVITLIAAMFLGGLIFPNSPQVVFLPLILGAIAILASVISTFFVKLSKNQSVKTSLYKGLVGAGIISAIGFLPVISRTSQALQLNTINLYLPAIIGILIAGGLFLITDFFTSKKYWSAQSIVQDSQPGHSENVITGLAAGMKSTTLQVLLISIGILISFWLGGIYGLAIAAVSMLSLAGLIIALDSYGQITNNALGITKMAGLSEKGRKNIAALNAVGNAFKATTKGYAIISAGLAALVLFFVYTQELLNLGHIAQFLLEDSKVLVGLFIGGMIVYYFAALAMAAVGKTALKVAEEARRQFKEIQGLMEGKARPEYEKCVDIVTVSALKEMMLPALLPVIIPILVGFILGPAALGGVLIGSIIVGIFLAIQMTTAGATWDNAKKYIEEGNLERRSSFVRQAAVTGNTVGDFCKDSAGSAINPMIKILNIVALLIASFLI